MANYREILRLNSLGFNHTQIAKSADCSRTTVINVLQLAKEKELEENEDVFYSFNKYKVNKEDEP